MVQPFFFLIIIIIIIFLILKRFYVFSLSFALMYRYFVFLSPAGNQIDLNLYLQNSSS